MESPSAVAATVPALATDESATPEARPLFHRVWPAAIIALGLGLSATWACLLGYEFVSVIALIIWTSS
jgi:hypothetical protein